MLTGFNGVSKANQIAFLLNINEQAIKWSVIIIIEQK